MQFCKIFVMHVKAFKSAKRGGSLDVNQGCIFQFLLEFLFKYVVNPTLVGLILYGEPVIGGDKGIRVAIAFAMIITSYLFLGSLGTLPWVGSYTNMISKVSLILIYMNCVNSRS